MANRPVTIFIGGAYFPAYINATGETIKIPLAFAQNDGFYSEKVALKLATRRVADNDLGPLPRAKTTPKVDRQPFEYQVPEPKRHSIADTIKKTQPYPNHHLDPLPQSGHGQFETPRHHRTDISHGSILPNAHPHEIPDQSYTKNNIKIARLQNARTLAAQQPLAGRPKVKASPFDEGQIAAIKGISKCPYPKNSIEEEEWNDGHMCLL